MTEDLSTSGSLEQEHTPSPTDPESQQHDPYGQDGGSDDDSDDEDGGHTENESFDALEDRFHGLEEEVATLVADVHDLALYTKLNITGFMKILKVRLGSLYSLCCCFKERRLPETWRKCYLPTLLLNPMHTTIEKYWTTSQTIIHSRLSRTEALL